MCLRGLDHWISENFEWISWDRLKPWVLEVMGTWVKPSFVRPFAVSTTGSAIAQHHNISFYACYHKSPISKCEDGPWHWRCFPLHSTMAVVFFSNAKWRSIEVSNFQGFQKNLKLWTSLTKKNKHKKQTRWNSKVSNPKFDQTVRFSGNVWSFLNIHDF